MANRKEEMKRDFQIEKFVITPDTLNSFEIMENRRLLGNTHVGCIHSALIEGKNPMGVMIVNKIGKKLRLIDGNHRIEAVKRYYSYRASKNCPSIVCTLRVYNNLSPEEERVVYSNEAKRRNESPEDRLNLYKDTINFWKLLIDPFKEFPIKVSIYNAKKTLRLRNILDMIYTSSKTGFNAKSLTKEEIISFAHNCNYDDFKDLKIFFEIFIRNFGEIGDGNLYAKKNVLIPLYDIFLKNKQTLGVERFEDKVKNILGKPDLLMYLQMGNSRELSLKMRDSLLEHMNKGISLRKFV